jgi:anti-sigma B factor antagonist
VERPELSISVQHAPDEVVFHLAGEIDMLTVARLSTMVTEALAESAAESAEAPARIVLDMAGVTFCDSQGLGTLVVLSRKASHARTVLSLSNVGDFLLRVLDITGLRSALVISDESRA